MMSLQPLLVLYILIWGLTAQNCYDPIENCSSCFQLLGHMCQYCYDQNAVSYNTGKCEPCNQNCLNCLINPSICENCIKGYSFNGSCWACHENCSTCHLVDERYCKTCKDNYLLYKHQCVPCSSYMTKCQQCKNSQECTKCQDYFYLQLVQNDRSINLTICANCQDYIPNCLGCTPQGDCIQCKNGTFLNQSKRCQDCPQAHYCINSVINQCSIANCKLCYGPDSCQQCYIHFRLNNTCIQCGKYQYVDNETCQQCQYPCLQCTKADVCTTCHLGHQLHLQKDCIKVCGNNSTYDSKCDQIIGDVYCNLTCQIQAGLQCINDECIFNSTINITMQSIERVRDQNTMIIILNMSPSLYAFQTQPADQLFSLQNEGHFSTIQFKPTHTGLIIIAHFESDIPLINMTLNIDPNTTNNSKLLYTQQSSFTFQLHTTDKGALGQYYTDGQFILINIISYLAIITSIISLVLGAIGLFLKQLGGLELLVVHQFVFINLLQYQNYLKLPFLALKSLGISNGYHYSYNIDDFSQFISPPQLLRLQLSSLLSSNFNCMVILLVVPLLLGSIAYLLNFFQESCLGYNLQNIYKFFLQQMLLYCCLFNTTYALACIIIFYHDGVQIDSFWCNIITCIVLTCTALQIPMFILQPTPNSIFNRTFKQKILCGKCCTIWMIVINLQVILLGFWTQSYSIGPLTLQICMVFFVFFYQPFIDFLNNIRSLVCWIVLVLNSVMYLFYNSTDTITSFYTYLIPLLFMLLLVGLTSLTVYQFIRAIMIKMQKKMLLQKQFQIDLQKGISNQEKPNQVLIQLKMMYSSQNQTNRRIKVLNNQTQCELQPINCQSQYQTRQQYRRDIFKKVKDKSLHQFDIFNQRGKVENDDGSNQKKQLSEVNQCNGNKNAGHQSSQVAIQEQQIRDMNQQYHSKHKVCPEKENHQLPINQQHANQQLIKNIDLAAIQQEHRYQ